MIHSVIYTLPTFEPVTLTEAKLHLKVDDTTDDQLIMSLIKAARMAAEKYTWITIPQTTLDIYLDDFPDGNIELDVFPVSAVGSIKYYNTTNTLTTWDSSNYITDMNGPLRITLAEGCSYPDTYDRTSNVVIRVTAGYANKDVIPEPIKTAIKLMVGHYYENREDVIVGRQVNELPMASKWLLDPYRIYAH